MILQATHLFFVAPVTEIFDIVDHPTRQSAGSSTATTTFTLRFHRKFRARMKDQGADLRLVLSWLEHVKTYSANTCRKINMEHVLHDCILDLG